jgi:hypothetical protein
MLKLEEFSKQSGKGTSMISKNGRMTVCKYPCFGVSSTQNFKAIAPHSMLDNPQLKLIRAMIAKN